MNETQLNGTQADDGVDGETMADEAQAEGNGGLDAEKLRWQRLRGFLRELVRDEGRMEAAELLGVAYRTLVKAEESGEITGRMGDALERLSNVGDNPEVTQLKESVGEVEARMAALEDGMEALTKELRDGLGEMRAAVSGAADIRGQGEERGEANDAAGKEADPSEAWTAPPVAGLRPKKPFRVRRKEPEVVTVEPADDDMEVYGDAWPLIEEWRSLRADHPSQGSSLSWLTTHERLLVLELAMLEERGLTLPPETQALRGFGRRGQTSWRWKALGDTRRALARRKLLRWVRRILTLWLWRK